MEWECRCLAGCMFTWIRYIRLDGFMFSFPGSPLWSDGHTFLSTRLSWPGPVWDTSDTQVKETWTCSASQAMPVLRLCVWRVSPTPHILSPPFFCWVLLCQSMERMTGRLYLQGTINSREQTCGNCTMGYRYYFSQITWALKYSHCENEVDRIFRSGTIVLVMWHRLPSNQWLPRKDLTLWGISWSFPFHRSTPAIFSVMFSLLCFYSNASSTSYS